MIRTITATLLLLALATAAAHAQYSTDVFTLKKAQDLYDERGFAQGKALSVDGKFIVSESNGNVSYTYPISSFTRLGFPIQTSLNYCGSVAFTTFRRYTIAHDDDNGSTSPYVGWEKFHQNRPAWIIGVNGFAAQVLATSTHFASWYQSKVNDADPDTIKNKDLVWAIDGYDFSNRMVDFGAYGSGESIGNTYVDNIRLLRADGSVLELVNAKQANETTVDHRPEVYTGYYVPMEANARGYAYVQFDSTYWMEYIRTQEAISGADLNPVTPRIVHYYPGDGLEYVFREWRVPFGSRAYLGPAPWNGGSYGGPTIFYLEQIKTTGDVLVKFERSRHFPKAGYMAPVTEDSTRGRALLLGFEGHTFEYGSNAMMIQALGRTTRVRFDKVVPSGDATLDTASMPMDQNGYYGGLSVALAKLSDSNQAVHRSWLGYVTQIIDPEGRRTSFTYEPYERRYVNFGFPKANVTVTLHNLRLRQITEPAARYVVDYFKKASDGNYAPNSPGAYVTSSGAGDTLSVYNDGTLYDQAKLSNVAAFVKKYDHDNTLLTTDMFSFTYQSGTTTVNQALHVVTDNIAGTDISTEQFYRRYTLASLAPKLPPAVYTSNYLTRVIGAGDTTVTERWTDATTSTSNATLWGSSYAVSGTPWGTPYLVLDTAARASVNGRLKSYSTIAYRVDTARRYGGDTVLTRLFGREVSVDTVATRNPATGGVIARKVTEYLHLPEVDTTATEIYGFMHKFEMYRLWDSLRQADTDVARLRWEQAMYDPRILRITYDTVYARHLGPPLFGLPRRSLVYDAAGTILAGEAHRYHATHDSLTYLSFTRRGLKLADTAIGAGGVAYRAAGYDYEYGLPIGVRTPNGALKWTSYATDYAFSIDSTTPSPVSAGAYDNRDSVRAARLLGALYGNLMEQPLAERSLVRRYTAAGALDTLTVEQFLERSYFGQVSATRDPNGWLSRVAYDADGRVRTVWMPGDFQNPDSVYTKTVTGLDSTDGYGGTADSLWHDWQICDVDLQPEDPVYPELQFSSLLYADDPVKEVPVCPDCPGTREKGGGHGLLALCGSPIAYTWQTPARATVAFTVLPAQVAQIVSLDSAWLRFHPTATWGECLTLKVRIPELSLTKTYLLNCDTSAASIDSNGYLNIDLTSVKSSLVGYTPGQAIRAILEVTTPGDRVAFASCFDGADTRPTLMLKGTFHKVNHLADYTLAYAYNDTLLRATVTAKVDDSAHSANKGRWNPMLDIARRTTARHYAGADGRLMASAVDIVEDHGGARTDSARHTYTGLGKRTRTVDPENDTTRTAYDALGRPVTATNADGTTAHMAYRYANPNSLGLDDSASYYGFAAVTTSTNENGVKFLTYTDAFDRKRREVADSNGLRLTTRYHYDTLGRLTRVINPKGDTTKYWYDPFGRVMAKSFPDIGVVSYAYDRKGNVRFSQNQEQEYRQLLTFNQYDDLDRLTLTGVAVFNSSYNEDVLNPDIHQARQRKRDRATVLSGGNPAEGRLTDVLDPDRLHTDTVTSILTANRTLWDTPVRSVPAITAAYNVRYCTLPADTLLGDLQTVSDTSIMRATAFYNASGGIAADTNDFEHIGLYPEFARIAVAYDTLPPVAGAVWGAFPSAAQWNALAPRGAVRNQRGREAAVAYRERGSEPFQYVVLSYDERGRVEALLRFTESLGFDAVYYRYNAMNTVVAVTDADVLRQHTTWYGTDANGRIDSVWTALGAAGSGLAGAPSGIRYPTPLARPTSPAIVYAYTKTGAVDTMRYPAAGVVVNYDYNHRKWLDSLVATKGTGKLFREILTHDPTGQIIAQVWQHGGGIRMKQNYAYDSTQRLKWWTHGQQTGGSTDTTAYVYDNGGNRQSASSTSLGTDTYLYNGGANSLIDRLHDPKFGNDVRAISQYTANGALAWRERHEEIGGTYALFLRQEEMAYSFRGLQMRYQTSAANGTALDDWRYGYSASGERELKRAYGLAGVNTTTGILSRQYYLLGGTNEQLAVYHGQETAGTLCSDTGRRVYMYAAEYLSHAGGTAAVTTLRGGARRYAIADHLGTVRVVVNDAGTIVSKTDYAPFGEPIAVAGIQPRKGYIDKETDVESSTLNTGVRQKDGERFLSVDPLWEKYPGLSPYVYAANSPISTLDRDGKKLDFAGDAKLEAAFITALEHVYECDPEQAQMMSYLYVNPEFTIRVMSETSSQYDEFDYEPNNQAGMPTIHWAPTGGFEYTVMIDGKPILQRLSPTACLIDECNSAYRFVTDEDQFNKDHAKGSDSQYQSKGERYSIEAAFEYASKAKEVEYIRQNHTSGKATQTKGVLSNEPQDPKKGD